MSEPTDKARDEFLAAKAAFCAAMEAEKVTQTLAARMCAEATAKTRAAARRQWQAWELAKKGGARDD